MGAKGIIDTARHVRNEAARAMDLIGTRGQGDMATRQKVADALFSANYSAFTTERLTEQYCRALSRAQDLSEQLYEATGQLADAADDVNRHLTSRNVPTIF